MADILIVLHLDIDIDKIMELTKNSRDDVLAKVRAYVAQTVGENFEEQNYGKLLHSAMAEEIKHKDIKPEHDLLRIINTHGTKNV